MRAISAQPKHGTLKLCILVSYASIFALAVPSAPLIRREHDVQVGALVQHNDQATDVTARIANLLEEGLAPGRDATIEREKSSKTTEADRLWLQFGVLDDRFSTVASKYMMSILESEGRNPQGISHTGDKKTNRTHTQGARNLVEVKAKSKVENDCHTPVISEQLSKANAKTLTTGKRPVLPYGFYVHAFFEAAAVVNQLRSIRKFYPEAPVYVMSDGGANYSGICQSISNCKFVWKAPAHDAFNPKPFLDRFREAAIWLQDQGAEFTIFLEPDVTLHSRASRPLRDGVDAGGLKDDWNPSLPIALRQRAQDLGRRFSGKKNFTISWSRYGLAGGSIIRTRSAVMAFKPDYINWLEFEKLYNQEVYSSDIAMLIALAAHGFDYYPWAEVSQPGFRRQYEHDTAFLHHNAGEKGGKPFYGKPLAKADKCLISPPPKSMQPLKNSQCQHCVWVDELECWPRHMNGKSSLPHIECPAVNESTFRRRNWTFKIEDPQPHLFKVL